MAELTERKCTRCGVMQSIEMFRDNGRPSRGSWCKGCLNAYRKTRYATDPEWRAKCAVESRRGELRRDFGIELREYEAMEARQGGACAICGQPCRTGRRLAVDHDHSTGVVRGLLCGSCNQAIGMAGDDPSILERAAAYLEARRER